MMLFLMVAVSTSCPGLLSAQSRIYITVEVGSRAVLPCDWRRIPSTQLASSSPHVEWCTFAGVVFERMGADMYQGEVYKDRADVPEDKLQEGNCSLVLKNVKPADAELYESFLLVKRTRTSKKLLLQSVELSVDDAPQKIYSQPKAAERNGGIIHTSSWITFFLLLNLLLYIS